ncbi:MAG: trimeric intracellular cation channel family protein, partial [Acetobacteraceae bacterium]
MTPLPPLPVDLVLNDAGTVAFALSGVVVGRRRGMDLFGLLVLAVVTAVSGGILRDLLIGAVPPEAVARWHVVALAIAAGLAGALF